MNCFDCVTQDHLARPGVGICHDCGAAVCEHHAVVRAHHLSRTMTMLREVPIEPAARTLRCSTCDAAYTAAHDRAKPALAHRHHSRTGSHA